MSEDIWYDEVFSVIYARKSFKDIIYLTGNDVHPPLYYFYLKLMSGLIRLLLPHTGEITASKLSSLVPYFALVIISFTVIRKRFSFFTASVFVFLMTFMPQLSNYYVEIRMYSLALLLITCAFLCAVRIVRGGPGGGDTCISAACEDGYKEKMRLKRADIAAYAGFFIFSLMAAYTQYFACVAVAGLYVFLGIFLCADYLTVRKQRARSKNKLAAFGLCIAGSIVLYIPWLPVLKKQIEAVSGSYWIQPLTLRSIFGCVKFIYLPVLSGGYKDYIPAVLTLAVSAAVMGLYIKRFISYGKENDTDVIKRGIFTAFAGVFILIFVFAIGFVLSALGSPVFVYRYLVPGLGVFYLGLSYMADEVLYASADAQAKKKRVPLFCFSVFSLCAFILGASFTAKGFYNEENKKLLQTPITIEALKGIDEGSTVVCNFDQTAVLMSFYLNEYLEKNVDIRLYEDDIDDAAALMLDTEVSSVTGDEIAALTADGDKEIYFFGSFNSREDILKDWEKLGIKNTPEGTYLLERYWFNVYDIRAN